MDDTAVRSLIYRRIADTGTAPSRQELIDLLGTGAGTQLRRMHDAHMIVLDERPHRLDEIRMALPFAAEATDFRVTSEFGAWWANCAWDTLGIAAATRRDATIVSTWKDTDEPLTIEVVKGHLEAPVGYINFRVPARRWWDDIVET